MLKLNQRSFKLKNYNLKKTYIMIYKLILLIKKMEINHFLMRIYQHIKIQFRIKFIWDVMNKNKLKITWCLEIFKIRSIRILIDVK